MTKKYLMTLVAILSCAMTVVPTTSTILLTRFMEMTAGLLATGFLTYQA